MRRRRARKPSIPTQNLDSFLDILTNTVGVLMFIGLFVALVSVEAGSIVRTPLVSDSNKNPYFFELRGNRITYIDDREVDRQINIFQASLPTCNEPNIPERISIAMYEYYLQKVREYNMCIENIISTLATFTGQTDYYRVTFIESSLLYEPLAENQGETKEELRSKESEFKQMLAELNPKTDYLAFIVRPDSFAAFRSARKVAWEQGFDVGWEPYQQDNPLVFGSGGRSIGVQ